MSARLVAVAVAICVAFACAASGATVSSGPYPTVRSSVSVSRGVVFRPESNAEGPFPLLSWQHGWLSNPDVYNRICHDIASHGFVIASTGTETGLFPDYEKYARDTKALLEYVFSEAMDNSESEFYGFVRPDGDWAAIGHSMGGGNLFFLIDIEPRIKTVIPLQPVYHPNIADHAVDYDGQVFLIAGENDAIVPATTVYRWFADLARAEEARSVYYEVDNMGHCGPCDTNPIANQEEEYRIHMALILPVLKAALYGYQNQYGQVFGSSIAAEPIQYAVQANNNPFLWRSPAAITAVPPSGIPFGGVFYTVGVAASEDASIRAATNSVLSDPPQETRLGTLYLSTAGIQPAFNGRADDSGVAEFQVTFPESSIPQYLQVLAANSHLSDVLTLDFSWDEQ